MVRLIFIAWALAAIGFCVAWALFRIGVRERG